MVRRTDGVTQEGQRFEALEQSGEVLRFKPPYALEWEWGGERFSFDFQPTVLARC